MRGHSYGVIPISWTNRDEGVSKLKLQEMGSRYLFIVLYVFLEHHLSRGDYRRVGSERPPAAAGPVGCGRQPRAGGLVPAGRGLDGLHSPGTGLLAAFGLAAFGLCYWRLFYGVDFTDEAWYVAVPYRFVLGGKPYLDELSVPQTTTAVLLYPFLWIYHALVGRTGMVLFVRHLHFLVAVAVGGAVASSLRRITGTATAVLAAIAAFAFVPFDIPSVSYDSLGSGLFTAGLVLGFAAASRPRMAPLAGLALGFAAFAYPPLVVAVAASCALRLVLRRGARRGELLGITVPALAVPILGFAALAVLAGPSRIVSDYRRSSHYLGQAGGLTKLHVIVTELRATLPLWYLLAAAVLLLAWSWARGWSWIAAAAVLVLPLTALPSKLNAPTASLDFVAHAGFLALPLLVGLRERREAVELFSVVWAPALLGGVLTSYSSANGGVNFGVGFFPAVVVTVVFGAWSIEKLVGRDLGQGAASPLLVVGVLLLLGIVPVYRDAPLSRLGTQLSGGPYAGLFTSDRKESFLAGLSHDLAGVDAHCTIAFFADFPAGYLLTAAQPDTNAVWIATVSARLTAPYHEDLVDFYRRHGFPDVVVVMHRIPFAPPSRARIETYAASDPLLLALRDHAYRLTARRLDYLVYRRASC